MQISVKSVIKFIFLAFAMYALASFLSLMYLGVQENPIIAFEELPVLGTSLYPILLTYGIFAGIFLYSKKNAALAGILIWAAQVGFSEDLVENLVVDIIRSTLVIIGSIAIGWILAYVIKVAMDLKVKTIASIPAIYITLLIIWQWILITINEFGFPLPVLGYVYFAILLLYPYLFWKVSTYTTKASELTEKF